VTGRAVLAAAAAAAALGGCGGDDDEPAADPVGEKSAGSVVQYADCRDWRGGTVAEREATVEALRRQLTPEASETAESPLSDERAYEILQRACSQDYARSMRLYKLYVRAQGFAPLSE
jgi:hypothetical protein